MHDHDQAQLEDEFNDLEEEELELDVEAGGQLSEEDEAQLASDLLSVQTEEELDYFLGGLLKTVGTALKSPTAKAVGGVLKSAAKKAVKVAAPAVGGALGSVVPGLGTGIGMALGTAASKMLELEGAGDEELEFEGAKSFVRMATDAIKQAEAASPRAHPRAVARSAVAASARKHAPALLRPDQGPKAGEQSGRWVRRGNRIVLFGV